MVLHTIIKELTEEFEGKLQKKLDNDKSVTHKIKFIDSFRFISSSLSNFVDNLSGGLHSDKCIDCKYCLDYISVNGVALKDNQKIFRCFECKNNYNKDFNK